MKAQIYLYNSLRKKFKKPIEFFKDTYNNNINPIFESIEEEAESIAEKRYQELGVYFNPDYHDPEDFAENALDAGMEYYEGMVLMRYNTKLMWISSLYHFWEQQIRKFVYKEVTRTHKLFDEKGNEVLFKDFCSGGINDIKWIGYTK